MDYPYNNIFKPSRIRYDTDSNYVSEFLQRMKIAHRNAIEQMELNMERIQDIFNRKANTPAFQVDDRVYLHDLPKVGINRKLAMKWTGPYRLIE